MNTEVTNMNLERVYNNLTKEASSTPLLLAIGAGAGIGGLYGVGDSKYNYHSELLSPSVGSRAVQGAGTAAAGLTSYQALRKLGLNPLLSGLGSLGAGFATAKALKPKGLIMNDPTRFFEE